MRGGDSDTYCGSSCLMSHDPCSGSSCVTIVTIVTTRRRNFAFCSGPGSANGFIVHIQRPDFCSQLYLTLSGFLCFVASEYKSMVFTRQVLCKLAKCRPPPAQLSCLARHNPTLLATFITASLELKHRAFIEISQYFHTIISTG